MVFVWDPHSEKCCPEDPTPIPVPSLLTGLPVVPAIYLSQTVCCGTWRDTATAHPGKRAPSFLCRGPFFTVPSSSTGRRPPRERHAWLLLLHARRPVGWQEIGGVLCYLCLGKTLSRGSGWLQPLLTCQVLQGCISLEFITLFSAVL